MEHSNKFKLMVLAIGLKGLMELAPLNLEAFQDEFGYNSQDRKVIGLLNNYNYLLQPVLKLE